MYTVRLFFTNQPPKSEHFNYKLIAAVYCWWINFVGNYGPTPMRAMLNEES